MARTRRSAKLDTWNARKKLTQGQAHQEPLAPGQYLGYRRPEKGGAGSWFARWRKEGKFIQARLGTADDFQDSDGREVLSYAQAESRAKAWFEGKAQEVQRAESGESLPNGPFAVADAMAAYLAYGEQVGKKGIADARSRSRVYIVPALGSVLVERLTRTQIEKWVQEIAHSSARVRGKRGQDAREGKEPANQDEKRARKATANKALAYLKAALNHARDRRLIHCSDDAWALVKPFRGVEEARQNYLTPDQQVRLINAVRDPDFRRLVQGALLTGCRYGELCRMACEDFEPNPAGHASVLIRETKGGKPRRVILTSAGRVFFESITAGRRGEDPIFTRRRVDKKGMEGRVEFDSWRPSDQLRGMRDACEAAKLPAMGFHQLRHSYASALVVAGMPLAMVAKLTGHADTRMLEKHYAHLAPSDLGKALELLAPDLRIEVSPVSNLKISGGKK